MSHENDYRFLIRLIGPSLPSDQDLFQILGVLPNSLRRHVDQKDGTVVDMWMRYITPRFLQSEMETSISQAIQVLSSLSAGIQVVLQQTEVEGNFYISTGRETQTGGFKLPFECISAIAQAGLSLVVSIMVLTDDEDDEVGADERIRENLRIEDK